MYVITGTGKQLGGVNGPTASVDLAKLGQNDEDETNQGRSVTHELNDGSYEVRFQGTGPTTLNLSGEFDNELAGAPALLVALKALRGYQVSVSRNGSDVGLGVVQSVNPSRQDRLHNKYPSTSWRLDILMEM